MMDRDRKYRLAYALTLLAASFVRACDAGHESFVARKTPGLQDIERSEHGPIAAVTPE